MVYGSVYANGYGSELSGVEPYEFDESMSFMEMGAQTLEESTNDWNSMMRAIALTELSYVAETGEELIYEAVDFMAIKDKVVSWFKKLWAKIQGIARTAMAKFKSFGKDDEGFISKYKEYFSKGYNNIPDGFSFKGYKFNDDAIENGPKVVKDASGAETNFAKNKGNAWNSKDADQIESDKHIMNTIGSPTWAKEKNSFTERQDQYRGTLVSNNGNKVSRNEFTKALNRLWRGNADAKQYLNKSNIDVNKLVEHVSGCKTAIENAKDGESALKDSIDECIDLVESVSEKIKGYIDGENDMTKAGNYSNFASAFTDLSDHLKQIEQINAQWYSAYINVLKERNRQSKAILVKLVGYANGVGGKKNTNEAASILEDRFATIFD